MRIVIIGAGMSGLACAQALEQMGHEVALFDKGRGPGGRMSTRRVAVDEAQIAFDHGAQFFTARDPAFRVQVEQWHKGGLVAPWPAARADAWVGTPGMNAPVAHMASAHNARFASHAMGLVREGAEWRVLLNDGTRHGPYDAAVLALPAEQAAAFLGTYDLTMAACAIAARSQPCWTAMIAFAERLPIAVDVLPPSGPVGWAARNSAKPGRPATEAWVVQASPAWSTEHLEDDAAQVAAHLADWLAGQAGGAPLPVRLHLSAHRWRYAVAQRSPKGALWNAKLRLGACGDWLLGPRIELAWLSGTRLAEIIGG